MIKKQTPQIPPPINAIEIDEAIYKLQVFLVKSLDWLTMDYGRAYRFVEKTEGKLYLPQVYKGEGDYQIVTPDGDQKGSVFFIVGDEENKDFKINNYNKLSYKVGLVFSVNLKEINKPLLENEKFTQLLIRDVRDLLTRKSGGLSFDFKIKNVQREPKDVFKEFNVREQNYNRVPHDVFRFNLDLVIDENCDSLTYDPIRAIVQNLSDEEKTALIKSFSSQFIATNITEEQKVELKNIL